MKNPLRRIARFAWPYRWIAFVLFFTVIFPVAMELVVPRALQFMIDQGIRVGDMNAIARGAAIMLGAALVGALATLGLSIMRASFSWCSLHPIGFAVGSVWVMNKLWFSIFLAWVIKSLVLRYGGPLVYRKAVSFFLGLILGTYSAAGLWFVVDLVTGKTGNVIFRF